MLSSQEFLFVAGVVLVYGAIRLFPRFVAGLAAHIAPEDLNEMLGRGERVLVLDVRTPYEYANEPGHVPGAVNIPLQELKMRLTDPELDGAYPNRPVITVCRTDSRAAFAVRILKRRGFTRAMVMSGGIGAWTRAGFSIVQGTGAGRVPDHTRT
jgi:rhodanese-related sulfurtransferase